MSCDHLAFILKSCLVKDTHGPLKTRAKQKREGTGPDRMQASTLAIKSFNHREAQSQK